MKQALHFAAPETGLQRRLWILFQALQRTIYVILKHFIVYQFSLKVRIVGRQIYNAVSTTVYKNGFLFTLLLGFKGFLGDGSQGMVGFRGADDTLCPGPGNTVCKCLLLGDSTRFYQTVENQLAYQGGHSVLPQSTGVKGRWHISVS